MKSVESSARVLAYYLPQYHPIPENDEWWGKGFTEWTNVAKAQPLYKGHWQPRLPADLGFYDLRVPEVREAQADLARSHGIEGFLYYHYWFGDGRRLLERPFNEVLASGKPDFPFALCWANATWSGVWYGESNRILVEQKYGGEDDFRAHFAALLPAFEDPRYICVNGKPFFQIYLPTRIPEPRRFTDLFRELAGKAGLPGLYLVGSYDGAEIWRPEELGFDALVSTGFQRGLASLGTVGSKVVRRFFGDRAAGQSFLSNAVAKSAVTTVSYPQLIEFMKNHDTPDLPIFPCVVPNWDNTPRSGVRGSIVEGSTPELFERHVSNALQLVERFPPEERFILVKSWNEWAEGNYLEPDTKFGLKYLEALLKCTQANTAIGTSSDA